MARTTRNFMTDGNWREARKGRSYDKRKSGTKTADLIAAGFVDYKDGVEIAVLSLPVDGGKDRPHWTKGRERYGMGNVRGGMLMSPSSSSSWRDDPKTGRAQTRRQIKRSQRQRLNVELHEQVEAYLAPDEDYSTVEFPLSGCCHECEAYYAGADDYEDYLYGEYEVEIYEEPYDPYEYVYEPIGLDYEGYGTDDWREDYRANWDLWDEDPSA